MKSIENLFLDFELCHESGDRLYPERISNAAGQMTYRWFHRGNLNVDSEETGDPNNIVGHAFSGKGIRCSTRNGSRQGIYKLTGSSIRFFRDKRNV